MPDHILITNQIKSFNKKINVSSDKSISIRSVLLASQAVGMAKITNLLESMNLPIYSPKLDISTFVNLMKKDKKNKNNRINYILLDGIGNSLVKGFVSEEISEFLTYG